MRSTEPAAEEEKERLLVPSQIVDKLLNSVLDFFGFGVLQLKDAELKRLGRLRRVELRDEMLDLIIIVVIGGDQNRVAVAVANNRDAPRLLSTTSPR